MVEGRFIERPNRFVAYVEIEGKAVKTHVPDPGRLKELLIPGVRVYVADYGDNPQRKTRYALCLVQSPEKTHWVGLNTQLPNQVVRELIEHGQLPCWSGYTLGKTEFRYGESRFDFLLNPPDSGGKPLLVEVKSVTLVLSGGRAVFPDAPTARGARHLRELTQARQSGRYNAGVLFVVQRADARLVHPNPQTDPVFCLAVEEAMVAGVEFYAMAYRLTPQHIQVMPDLLPVYSAAPAHLC